MMQVKYWQNSFSELVPVSSARFAEGEFAQSRADFISKYSIALKEASETRYWIDIMIQYGIISENKFSLMIDEVNIIIRILISTIKKLKEK